MFSRPVKETSVDVRAELSSLNALRDTARSALSETRLPGKEVERVCLALEEAASNVIRHAYLSEPGIIRLKIVSYSQRVIISLVDFGRPYFPESGDKVSLSRLVETSRKGGLGRMMIEKLMDDVEYIVGDGYNELRLTKFLKRKLTALNPLEGRALSLRTRFSLATLSVLALMLVATVYFVETRVVSGVKERQRNEMQSSAKSAAALAGSYILNQRTYVEFDELVYSVSAQRDEIRRVSIIDTAGITLADSRNIKSIRKPYQSESGPYDPTWLKTSTTNEFTSDGYKLEFITVPIVSHERTLGALAVEYDASMFANAVSEARTDMLWLLLAELLLGLLAIFWLSRYFVNPIIAITNQVRRISEGSHPGELPVNGAAEFFEISRAMHQMMTRLRQDTVREQKRAQLDKEIEVAAEIQQALLPKQIPNIPGLELATFYESAHSVGGDLYDVFPIGDNRYCIVVADVSGKGVPASLVMASLRTVIRFKAQGQASPGEILKRVEEHMMADIPEGVFITAGLSVYDAHSRSLRYSSAGHNPLILFSKERGEFVSLNPRGGPLGLGQLRGGDGTQFEEAVFVLKDGDYICFYTDGVTDLEISPERRLGSEGLIDTLRLAGQDASGPAMMRKVVARLNPLRENSTVDDLTLIIGSASQGSVAEASQRMAVDGKN